MARKIAAAADHGIDAFIYCWLRARRLETAANHRKADLRRLRLVGAGRPCSCCSDLGRLKRRSGWKPQQTIAKPTFVG